MARSGVFEVPSTETGVSRPPSQGDIAVDRGFTALALTSSVALVLLVAFILYEIGRQAAPAIADYGPGFLLRSVWDVQNQNFGILPEIWGTLYSSLLALLLGGFFGLTVAIFLTQDFLPAKLAAVFRTVIDMLAAIPSVVFGLWGIFVVIPAIRPAANWLHETLGFIPLFSTSLSGPGLLPAAIVLAIMILPTVAAISQDALRQIPYRTEAAAYGTGATRWEAILRVMLPTALPAISTGIILGIARVAGQSPPVLFTALLGNDWLSSSAAPTACLSISIHKVASTPFANEERARDRMQDRRAVLRRRPGRARQPAGERKGEIVGCVSTWGCGSTASRAISTSGPSTPRGGRHCWDEVADKLEHNELSLSGGQQQRLCIARAIAIVTQTMQQAQRVAETTAFSRSTFSTAVTPALRSTRARPCRSPTIRTSGSPSRTSAVISAEPRVPARATGREAMPALGRRAVPAAVSRGEIRSWNDPAIVAAVPGLDLPEGTIVLVARRDATGTTYAPTDHLTAVDPVGCERHGVATRVDWLGTAMPMRGNEGVSGRLEVAESRLGCVEPGFAEPPGLAVAELENREGRSIARSTMAGKGAPASAGVAAASRSVLQLIG
ncbi:MAG: phosphate ABC transporter permease subunit PstC [Geminicoccaceae bacterium]|nr:phosphate ABC transporter permease subunit PstC [Geminicoccaceae bacterium]